MSVSGVHAAQGSWVDEQGKTNSILERERERERTSIVLDKSIYVRFYNDLE